MDIQNRVIELCTAVSGQMTAKIRREDGRELYLHSSVDPVEEARFLLKDIPIIESTLYVVIGFGFGYHVKELLKRISQNSHVVVIESSKWKLSTAVQEFYQKRSGKWFTNNRLTVLDCIRPDTVCFTLAHIFMKYNLYSLEMFTHIPSVATDEKFYQQVIETVPKEFAMRLSANINTIDTTLENNLTNYIANLSVTWRNASVEGFKNKWVGQPLIIVSAGPSLTAQLSLLKRVEGKVIIVCVGTAAKTLMKHSIRPDFVIAIDPYFENMAHFEGWDTAQTALLYYQSVWREIPAVYKGFKFWFNMLDENPIPLRSEFRGSEFWGGGTVAFSALQFAKYVQASPVIFVGQDLSFYKGRTHADGILYNLTFSEENLPEGFFYVPGVNGTSVITNQIYYSFLVLMQEYILRNQDVKYINTSPTGAAIEGTEVKSLDEAIREFCTRTMNIGEVISQENTNFTPVRTNAVLTLLNKWEKEILRFLQKSDVVTDVDELFSYFKKLEIYKTNHNRYQEFFYAVCLKEKWFDSSAKDKAAERLRSHVAFILEEITRIRAELI